MIVRAPLPRAIRSDALFSACCPIASTSRFSAAPLVMAVIVWFRRLLREGGLQPGDELLLLG